MAKISHRPHLKYEFKVMDSPVINAFAVPGGYIYITRGILSHMNNEAELAGVIGHEIGHVTARHSAQKYTEATLAQVGLGIGSMISEDFAQYAGLAAQGIGLLFLKFSRDDERQSDVLGVEYSTKVGYDSREMSNLFATLDKMSHKEGQGGLPDWLSTHPNPADRVVDVRKEAVKVQKQLGSKDLKTDRENYMAKVNGMVYGENPRQGFVENGIFYHPDMKFQFPVPNGWKVSNLPSQVQMASADQKGFIIFTLAATSTVIAASDQFIAKTKATVSDKRNQQINGLKALVMASEIADASSVLRLQSYFIEKSGKVFEFHGLSDQSTFSGYQGVFTATMTGFKELRDKAKLNVQPNRIRINRTVKSGSFRQIMAGFGMPESEMEELALMNGVDLNDTIAKNTQLKTIVINR
jgi:predicted Zn-dependent protease